MNEYYCFCVNPPPRGVFAANKKYPCAIPEKEIGILVYDDLQDAVFFENSESNRYFQFYVKHEEVPIYDLPDEKLFLVLTWGKPTVAEIRAYAHILKVNYISAKQALSNGQTFIAKGNYHYIEEICTILDQYGVKYERIFEDK